MIHLRRLANESRHDLAVMGDALAQRDLADRPLGTLSGGERQRAVLARALAQEASLLFLGELTTALDISHIRAQEGIDH